MHTEEVVPPVISDEVPAAQLEHEDEDTAAEYFPEEQDEQIEEPASENEPTAQSAQVTVSAEAPVVAEYVPAPQLTQAPSKR